MQYIFITEQETLNAVIKEFNKQDVIAIDTEFMRRRTLYPELALLQVYDGHTIALIDPTIDLDLNEFWQLLTNENILKIF